MTANYEFVQELLARWEAEAAQVLPSDAVLLREKIGDLRKALATCVAETLPPVFIQTTGRHPLDIASDPEGLARVASLDNLKAAR